MSGFGSHFPSSRSPSTVKGFHKHPPVRNAPYGCAVERRDRLKHPGICIGNLATIQHDFELSNHDFASCCPKVHAMLVTALPDHTWVVDKQLAGYRLLTSTEFHSECGDGWTVYELTDKSWSTVFILLEFEKYLNGKPGLFDDYDLFHANCYDFAACWSGAGGYAKQYTPPPKRYFPWIPAALGVAVGAAVFATPLGAAACGIFFWLRLCGW